MTTYRQFLDAHKSAANRYGHAIALELGFLTAVTLGMFAGWAWSPFGLVVIGVGGGLSHKVFGGNSPAFFNRPWEIPLLLAYDVRMFVETIFFEPWDWSHKTEHN